MQTAEAAKTVESLAKAAERDRLHKPIYVVVSPSDRGGDFAHEEIMSWTRVLEFIMADEWAITKIVCIWPTPSDATDKFVDAAISHWFDHADALSYPTFPACLQPFVTDAGLDREIRDEEERRDPDLAADYRREAREELRRIA